MIAALAVATTVTAGLFIGSAATASPQATLAQKKAQAQKLEAQIEADQNRAEMLDEQYLTAQNAVADAQQKIDAGQRDIEKAQANAAALQLRLGGRAATLYMGAGNSDPFNINAADVRDLGSRARYSEAAADEDTRLLSQLQVAQEQLRIQRKDLQRVQAVSRDRQHTADVALGSLKKATSQAQNALASVNSDIKGLVSQIAAQKAAADAARAKAAFVAVQQRAHTSTGGGGGGGGGSSGTPASGPNPVYSQPNPNAPAPSPAASGAVSYAYAQLGKPYRYAGTGPDSYDCSGLTMMAWASVGVGMPHSSFAQATMFPRVSDSDLQPGDLSIYYGDHHHVGIYVGNGMTISATHTGDYIKLQPVFRSGYQFSVRP